MNWVKSKKQRIALIVSVAMILCSFTLIPLSQKAENFPHDIWSHLILVICMAGGGGIGAVISLNMIARRIKRTCNMSPDRHVNRLKKKAKKDFLTLLISTVVGLLGFGFLTYADAKGAWYLVFSLNPVFVMILLIIIMNSRKENIEIPPDFDEREFHLLQRAIHWGNNCFMGYSVLAMITAFNLIGGRGMVPMWSIPVALFTGLLVGGTVQFCILMHAIKKDEKSFEGGAA